MPYAIRLATDEDQPRVLELLGELLPGTDPVCRQEWIHLGNPAGRSMVFVATEEKSGEVVG